MLTHYVSPLQEPWPWRLPLVLHLQRHADRQGVLFCAQMSCRCCLIQSRSSSVPSHKQWIALTLCFSAWFWADKDQECVVDSGLSYRGTKFVTKSGARCLPWDVPVLRLKRNNAWRSDALELGLGSHSFCRYTHQLLYGKTKMHVYFPFHAQGSGKLHSVFVFLLPLSNRNPDADVGPWCHIYKNTQLTWELCDIPKCCELPHYLSVNF